jgi:hypothetical protein
MPYLITASPTGAQHVVDTLEEVAAVYVDMRQIATEVPGVMWPTLHLNEQGGTIGPLPDGTVIEVRPLVLS